MNRPVPQRNVVVDDDEGGSSQPNSAMTILWALFFFVALAGIVAAIAVPHFSDFATAEREFEEMQKSGEYQIESLDRFLTLIHAERRENSRYYYPALQEAALLSDKWAPEYIRFLTERNVSHLNIGKKTASLFLRHGDPKSAEHNFIIGMAYTKGGALGEDVPNAVRYLLKAASSGHEAATAHLANIYTAFGCRIAGGVWQKKKGYIVTKLYEPSELWLSPTEQVMVSDQYIRLPKQVDEEGVIHVKDHQCMLPV